MVRQQNQVYKDVVIEIEGTMLKWENRVCPLAAVSELWSGNIPNDPLPVTEFFLLLFIALSGFGAISIALMVLLLAGILGYYTYRLRGKKGINGMNIKLNTGQVYSFIAESEEFTELVCRLISELINKQNVEAAYQIDFQNDGLIKDNTLVMDSAQVVQSKQTDPKTRKSSHIQNPLVMELERLLDHCENKEQIDTEAVELIARTFPSAETYNKDQLKNSFEQFIKYGLIHDCNELGLNVLLNEIRSCIYM